ncbi:hypothetical protein [Tepidimicrobium xylanilyticum]|uniref:hypothetical protein n=1 Tax=Tepidimicrobium xylanilyticum TaxID=1123352 RepID=UPI00135666E9|nr:hypothetical protein [Tepidimicrobium xylanilyticum]
MKSSITVKGFATRCNVSIRTIIEVVESWLKEENIAFYKKSGMGMWFDVDNEEKELIE